MRELIQVFKTTALEWNRHNAPRLGAALAYYTVLSLAPLLVVVVAIAGFAFGQQAAEGQIVWQIREFVGPTGAEAIQSMLTSARHPKEGLLAATLGIVVLLTSASAVFAKLRDSLNYIWGVQLALACDTMRHTRAFPESFRYAAIAFAFNWRASLSVSDCTYAASRYTSSIVESGSSLDLRPLSCALSPGAKSQQCAQSKPNQYKCSGSPGCGTWQIPCSGSLSDGFA
jgi:membrane protein